MDWRRGICFIIIIHVTPTYLFLLPILCLLKGSVREHLTLFQFFVCFSLGTGIGTGKFFTYYIIPNKKFVGSVLVGLRGYVVYFVICFLHTRTHAHARICLGEFLLLGLLRYYIINCVRFGLMGFFFLFHLGYFGAYLELLLYWLVVCDCRYHNGE